MANTSGAGGKSAARLKKRNETKMILRQPVLLLAVLASIALLVLFVIYPLGKVLLFSLTDEAAMSRLLPCWPFSPHPGIWPPSAGPCCWAWWWR